MIKGSELRAADHPIENLFLDRWSPRAMSAEAVSEQELMALFEAARWAPSAYNNQPWRFLYAHRDSEHWPLFFDLLVEPNKVWCVNAGALIVIISKSTFDHNGKPSLTHTFDCGAAWGSMALQGALKGLVVHGMQGFDYNRARTVLNVPDEYCVEAMAAVGRPGAAENLPEELRAREFPSDRKKLTETVREGRFCF